MSKDHKTVTNRHQIPITVFTILVNEMDEVLLMRRANTGFGDGQYSLPGGHLEKGEQVRYTAMREVLEETGIILHNVKIMGVIHSDVDREYLHFIAFATPEDWEGEARNTEPDQCDDLKWCPWGDWPENTLPCIRMALNNLSTGVFFGEYFPKTP